MIPQRNLSLLANRLAREGGRRIPENVLERDYCLAWFLAALAESELKTALGFKGGTALKRCYFGGYRISEDLDFTLTTPAALDDLKTQLEPVYAALREAAGIVFGLDREDRQKHDNTYTFYLRYEGPLPNGSDVKVDITCARSSSIRSSSARFCGATRNSRTCRGTGFCSSIRWRKLPPRKSWHSRTRHATNPGTSTIYGISRPTRE